MTSQGECPFIPSQVNQVPHQLDGLQPAQLSQQEEGARDGELLTDTVSARRLSFLAKSTKTYKDGCIVQETRRQGSTLPGRERSCPPVQVPREGQLRKVRTPVDTRSSPQLLSWGGQDGLYLFHPAFPIYTHTSAPPHLPILEQDTFLSALQLQVPSAEQIQQSLLRPRKVKVHFPVIASFSRPWLQTSCGFKAAHKLND